MKFLKRVADFQTSSSTFPSITGDDENFAILATAFFSGKFTRSVCEGFPVVDKTFAEGALCENAGPTNVHTNPKNNVKADLIKNICTFLKVEIKGAKTTVIFTKTDDLCFKVLNPDQ